MAGYRPKSLDELNNIYDKTMAAERAIKKGTSLLNKAEETAAVCETTPTEAELQQEKQTQELGEALSGLLDSFSREGEKKPVVPQAEEKPKPQMTVLSRESIRKEMSDEDRIAITERFNLNEPERERSDRDELMDEYMKIMNDEDEEAGEKKLSRKQKKKQKRAERASSEKTEEPETTEDVSSQENDTDLFSQQDTPLTVNEQETAVAEAEDREITTEAPEYSPYQGENEGGDFDFPENYTPQWIEETEQEFSFAEEKPESSEEKKEKQRKKGKGVGFIKVLLSLVLVLVIIVGSFTVFFKTVFAVNTGKTFAQEYYFFTAKENYSELEIYKGDLVITEKGFAEDGDVFAYTDYDKKAFSFGKRSSSIINNNGDILIVTENQGERTLVTRDDCKGIVYATYPAIGTYIGLLTDNFVVVMALASVIALTAVLIMAVGLRGKKRKNTEEKSEDKSQEPEQLHGTEEEEENLFASL